MALTQERLKELLHYDPETGVFTWTSNAYSHLRGKPAGCQRHDGYLRIRVDAVEWLGHRLAWLYMHGVTPAQYVDHRDGDPSNNRFSNLRLCTQRQNLANSKLSSANTSGYKGVWLDKRRGRWSAEMKVDGVKYSLGSYIDKEDAYQVRNAFSRLMNLEFHRDL